MKALEILKEIRNIETEYDHRKEHRFDEAIKELEVIQDIILEKDEALDIERLLFKNKLESLENRSCESCKYSKDIFSYTYPLCTEDENNPFQIHNIEKLKCNKWKNKC